MKSLVGPRHTPKGNHSIIQNFQLFLSFHVIAHFVFCSVPFYFQNRLLTFFTTPAMKTLDKGVNGTQHVVPHSLGSSSLTLAPTLSRANPTPPTAFQPPIFSASTNTGEGEPSLSQDSAACLTVSKRCSGRPPRSSFRRKVNTAPDSKPVWKTSPRG